MYSNASKALLFLVTVSVVCGITLLRGVLDAGAGRLATGGEPAEGHGLSLTDIVQKEPTNRLPAFDVPSRLSGPVNGPARLAVADVSIAIGTLPAGKSVTIVFDTTPPSTARSLAPRRKRATRAPSRPPAPSPAS